MRELSIMSARKAPIAMQFVPNSAPSEVADVANNQQGIRDLSVDAVFRQPTRCRNSLEAMCTGPCYQCSGRSE